jgi:hypothetical protein
MRYQEFSLNILKCSSLECLLVYEEMIHKLKLKDYEIKKVFLDLVHRRYELYLENKKE